MLKRQREIRRTEKAARKRAKRHGLPDVASQVPTPTVGAAERLRQKAPAEHDPADSPPNESVERGDTADR
jgi:hypothetical protein